MRFKYPKDIDKRRAMSKADNEGEGLSRKEFLAILTGGAATAIGATTLIGNENDKVESGYGQGAYGGKSTKSRKA